MLCIDNTSLQHTTPSYVMSSCVGPIPPVVITYPVGPTKSESSFTVVAIVLTGVGWMTYVPANQFYIRTSSSSGITTTLLRSIPRLNMNCAMKCEFVSCVY